MTDEASNGQVAVGERETYEQTADQLRAAIAAQAATIDRLTGERDGARILAGHHQARLQAANEYIAWLERELQAALGREEQ